VVFGWGALRPPRVVFVIGCVSCNTFSHFRQNKILRGINKSPGNKGKPPTAVALAAPIVAKPATAFAQLVAAVAQRHSSVLFVIRKTRVRFCKEIHHGDESPLAAPAQSASSRAHHRSYRSPPPLPSPPILLFCLRLLLRAAARGRLIGWGGRGLELPKVARSSTESLTSVYIRTLNRRSRSVEVWAVSSFARSASGCTYAPLRFPFCRSSKRNCGDCYPQPIAASYHTRVPRRGDFDLLANE
jgi:hypothetical protein